MMNAAARQFLRALRGRRSQVGFSKRLGYASNIAARWEAGSRFPTATTALLACQRLGMDLPSALRRFHEPSAARLSEVNDQNLAEWLHGQRGSRPISEISERSGLSHYQIRRSLAGITRPSLPVFFELVEAMTGRLAELVSLLVDIRHVPALLPRYLAHETARRCAYEHPWSSAVLALIDVVAASLALPVGREGHRIRDVLPTARMAAQLGTSEEQVVRSLEALEDAHIVRLANGQVLIDAPLITDTRRDPERAANLRRHWSLVSLERLNQPRAGDSFSHNVFAVSREDLAQLKNMQAEFYQRARALIADSKRSEVSALMLLHLLSFDDD